MSRLGDGLRKIRNKLTGRKATQDAKVSPVPAGLSPLSDHVTDAALNAPPVLINLGIDFGTSFTKVCFRDTGAEVTKVVPLSPNNPPIIASVLAIDKKGRLSLESSSPGSSHAVKVRYLKMRLAGSTAQPALPVVTGVDLNSPESVKALAAWFLASVVKLSQQWLLLNEADRFLNRTPLWSANIGVPVEHYDSELLGVFEEVLRVAWAWATTGQLPETVSDAVASYESALKEIEVSDFHAVPEIAAAVYSFVMSRSAVPGMYIYFDVGGGTLDGVSFHYSNMDGTKKIGFHSGKVAPLGISVLAELLSVPSHEIDARSFEQALKKNSAGGAARKSEIRKLVGAVVMEAKRKDPSSWIQDIRSNATFIGRLPPERMKPLRVFVGGGGARSSWYKSTIASTYDAFKQHNAGIPPYQLSEVPTPRDFLSPTAASEFDRFAVSYGLSIPQGMGPDVGLPSQYEEVPIPTTQEPRNGAPNYLDGKDII